MLMINLLPPETKQDILYARRNTKLLHWSVAMLTAMAGTMLVVGFGLLYLKQSTKNYNAQLEATTAQLKLQKLDETQKRVQDISSSLKLVIQVLGREVLFSKLLQQIGAAMPSGSVLTGLSINKVQGGIDLSAAATTYQTATQVQVNLRDPANKIFEKADIVTVQCSSAGGGGTSELDAKYPCKVTVRALFATNNPFLFINKSGGTP
jgi:Tfp pilus assembly protein PilN